MFTKSRSFLYTFCVKTAEKGGIRSTKMKVNGKKSFEKCVVETIDFSKESVITTSNGGLDPIEGEEQQFPWEVGINK